MKFCQQDSVIFGLNQGPNLFFPKSNVWASFSIAKEVISVALQTRQGSFRETPKRNNNSIIPLITLIMETTVILRILELQQYNDSSTRTIHSTNNSWNKNNSDDSNENYGNRNTSPGLFQSAGGCCHDVVRHLSVGVGR